MPLIPSSSLFLGGDAVDRLYRGSSLVWEALRPGFQPLTIGGGGWVTGLVVQGNRMYCRTDVGGAYRYEPDQDRWAQMITAVAVRTDKNESDYQVEALACAPSDPDVVYAAVGDGPAGRVLASTDGGVTWPISSPRSWYIAGNDDHRFAGSRLAVDPSNPQVVYFGTRRDGLHYSMNGGTSWTRVSGLPATAGDVSGAGAVGVPCLIVDPSSAIAYGRHQTIWASVFGVGLLRSNNGGSTWSTVSSWTSPGAYVRDMVRASNGNIIAAFYSPNAAIGEVRKITPGNVVTEIGPKKQNWTSVAVHPSNPALVYAAPDVLTKYYSFYRTSNGTASTPSWSVMTDFSYTQPGDEATRWLTDKGMPTNPSDPYLWVGQIGYFGDSLFLAEGHGVWRATKLAVQGVAWESHNHGIEELCANAIVKPAGHPPLSCQWDYGLIRHTQPAALPYRTDFGSGWDVAVSPTDPNFVAVIMDDHQDTTGRTYPSRRASGYSTDGGATVTRFAALANGSAPSDMLFGNIAVSAGDNDNLVWVPSNKTGAASKIYATTNRGATWSQASLSALSAYDALHQAYYYARHILVADPLAPGTFYALGHNTSTGAAVIWRSTDKGRTWSKVATSGLSGSYRHNPTLVHDGTALWAVPGDGGNGIFRSTNGSAWVAKNAIGGAQRLGVGAPMPGSSVSTLFSFGTVGGKQGLHLSRDGADSWELMTDYPCDIYSGIRHIAGDPEIPGRVYVGLGGGNGFVVGQA